MYHGSTSFLFHLDDYDIANYMFLLLFAAQMINLYSPLWDLPSLSNSSPETDPSGIYPIQYYVISLTQYNPVGTMYKDGKQQF